MQAIAGEFHIDWSAENLEHTTQTIVRKYNAEIHSQSAIEGILELKREYGFHAEDVGHVDLETFDVAYNIIGGGEEGNRRMVRSKEEADHSLPYILAVALIDSQVMPPQYQPERIARSDVQALLQRITVRPAEDLSRRFPDEMPCRFTVHLRDGRLLTKEKRNYEGFHSAPIAWDGIVKKFEQLAEPYTSAQLRREIVACHIIRHHAVRHMSFRLSCATDACTPRSLASAAILPATALASALTICEPQCVITARETPSSPHQSSWSRTEAWPIIDLPRHRTSGFMIDAPSPM